MNATLHLESVTYWTESDERRAQHFYIGFCLLMSSIQDALLGQRELAGHNLNWSATCSYYSMVHAARMLFFLPFGDFPTQHDRLRSLLNPDETQPRPEPRVPNRFPFNWLQDFAQARSSTENRIPQHGSPGEGTRQPAIDWRGEIIRYFESGVADAADRVKKFGGLISRGAALRNDSNYEALLIAHEYQHDEMTEAFELLAKNMGIAAEQGVILAIDAFRGFLEHDADLANERNDYRAFLHTYAQDRIQQPLQRKLAVLPAGRALEAKLKEYVARLCPQPAHGNFQRLEDHVSMVEFERKTGRMRRFLHKIDSLSEFVK